MESTRTVEPTPSRISRQGRKLPLPDEQRLLATLPKDIPERIWAELFQREEIDLTIFDIREEIIDNALDICYQDYMDRQSIAFTVHCVAKAWLQLMDWNFLRHDPGEDPTAYPPCDIPKRNESWKPDEMPEPSPKDSWANEVLTVVDVPIRTLAKRDSSSSLEYPDLSPVPSEYWFPGKVEVPGYEKSQTDETGNDAQDSASGSASTTMDIASEVLERVTDYSKDTVSKGPSPPDTTPPLLSGGGGDSVHSKTILKKPKQQPKKKEKLMEQPKSKSKLSLPPLKLKQSSRSVASRSRASTFFDGRRSLRLDTQYEVASEEIESLKEKSPKKK